MLADEKVLPSFCFEESRPSPKVHCTIFESLMTAADDANPNPNQQQQARDIDDAIHRYL